MVARTAIYPPAWQALVQSLNGRTPDGIAGIRDVDHPCDMFEPVGEPWEESDGGGTCETDGHYLCSECTQISSGAVRHRRDQCEECATPLVRCRWDGREPTCCPSCKPEDLAVPAVAS